MHTRGILRKGLPVGSTESLNQVIEGQVIDEMKVDHLIGQEKHFGTMKEIAIKINEAVKKRMVA